MNRTIQTVGAVGILFALCSVSPATAADETGWRLKLGAASVHPSSGDSAFGAGLGLEYRASRRLGIELAALTSELEDEMTFDFFGVETVTIETALRTTPVLAKLNVHLTPDRRADVYLGPVVGRMLYDDMDIVLRSSLEGEIARGRIKTRDTWAWGAHAGVDVPVGDRGLFFSAGVTWLQAEVEIEGDPEDEEGDLQSDLDPLVAQIGFGYRF